MNTIRRNILIDFLKNPLVDGARIALWDLVKELREEQEMADPGEFDRQLSDLLAFSQEEIGSINQNSLEYLKKAGIVLGNMLHTYGLELSGKVHFNGSTALQSQITRALTPYFESMGALFTHIHLELQKSIQRGNLQTEADVNFSGAYNTLQKGVFCFFVNPLCSTLLKEDLKLYEATVHREIDPQIQAMVHLSAKRSVTTPKVTEAMTINA